MTPPRFDQLFYKAFTEAKYKGASHEKALHAAYLAVAITAKEIAEALKESLTNA